MRRFVKRGFVSSRTIYHQLKSKVWDEVRQLDQDREIIHGHDIQEIAMSKAQELGLYNFQVRTHKYSMNSGNNFYFFILFCFPFFDFGFRQVWVGCIILN